MARATPRTLVLTWLKALALIALVFLAACKTPKIAEPMGVSGRADFPSYQPIYPVTVWEGAGGITVSEDEHRDALLRDIANEQMLFAVTKVDGSAAATYGPAALTVEGGSYRATIDYLKYHSLARPVFIYSEPHGENDTRWTVTTASQKPAELPANATVEYEGPLPIYVGLGLRVQTFFTSQKGNLSVGSLGAIGAQAEASHLSGSLSVQTLGLSSERISTLLPLETELSMPAIQRVIEAVAAIKANIYSDGTVANPQLVGFQSPLSDPGAIASLIRFVYGIEYTYTLQQANLSFAAAGTPPVVWVSWPNFEPDAGSAVASDTSDGDAEGLVEAEASPAERPADARLPDVAAPPPDAEPAG